MSQAAVLSTARWWRIAATFLLLSIGVSLGVVADGALRGEPAAGRAPIGAPGGPASSTSSNGLGEAAAGVTGLPDFRAVVKNVVPSVVTVRSQRSVDVQETPFLNPFEEFFGPGPFGPA